MPAMHLTRVDLPAPLSPTRAITSPLATWKSTPFSACTAPNVLWTPRSSSRASVLTLKPPPPPGKYGAPPAWRRPCFADLGRYWMPAFLHADAYFPVQISFGVRNPSAITVSLMLAEVTATGLRSTDGVCVPLLSVLPLVVGV